MTTEIPDAAEADLPPPDPLTPFAVAGGPAPDIPITDAHLEAAHERFCACYADLDHAAIRRGAQKALAAARQRDRWTVLPDGRLELRGSRDDVYSVTDELCCLRGRVARNGGPVLCPSFRFGQSRHGGQCYHLIARELIRIAQALASPSPSLPSTASDEPDSPLAFVSLASDELAAACLLALRAHARLHVSAVNGVLHLRAGARAITLDAQEGAGVAALALTADAVAQQLWAPLQRVAHHRTVVQLFLDGEAGALHLCADGEGAVHVSVPAACAPAA